MALLAELTYRCPLRCGYCSNPADWGRYTQELDTDTWRRVIREAAAVGVLHLHLSGGEPLLRHDLEDIAREGRDVGLFVNLITSAWSATPTRLAALAHAGVEHVQISFQDSDPALADRIAGTTAHATKLDAAREVRALGMALSINVVLHRGNLARVGALIELAVSLGAQRIELANTQFHGSALANQRALLPTRTQLDEAIGVALAARERLRGVLDVIVVMPDWFTDAPRPCMDGWGKRFMTVAPDGTALPCPGAHGLQGMRLENVRDHDLAALWYRGADFERFRGTTWMPEPCASCERREIDHGGCRCQAFALTGDAAATDPACVKAPRHDLVRGMREVKHLDEVLYRIDLTRMRRG
jgi:pyrroloquinoline quinone biosynthesis protein E